MHFCICAAASITHIHTTVCVCVCVCVCGVQPSLFHQALDVFSSNTDNKNANVRTQTDLDEYMQCSSG